MKISQTQEIFLVKTIIKVISEFTAYLCITRNLRTDGAC